MASFRVLSNFRRDTGEVYIAGDTITGLSAAEAKDLLQAAPAGTFTPVDEEAQTVADYIIRIGGSLGTEGEVG